MAAWLLLHHHDTTKANILWSVVSGGDELCPWIVTEPQNELPESRSMRVENKMFYFDVGSNRRGVYLRVSEVSSLFCNI